MPKTGFLPHEDSFAFVNSWQLSQGDSQAVLRIVDQAVGSALSALEPLFGGLITLAGLATRLKFSAQNPNLQTYGLCGGMAFAALDYYNAAIPIPSAITAPTRANSAGSTMRDYILRRQVDSLRDNLANVIVWITVLNYIPQWWSFKSGAPWLLERSMEQWKILKNNIEAGQPTPLALIGTTKDPMENHQVLAYGYEEPDPASGAGATGLIYVYDMNCPGAGPTVNCQGGERTIQLDFRGKALSAQECCPSQPRGPLRGLICEKYSRVTPPVVQDWTTLGPI